GRLLKTLHVGDNPRTVALTPDGTRAWVSAEAGGNVTVIDVATDSVVAQFPIRDGKTKPVRIAFSPDGRLAYLTEGAAASVSVADPARRESPPGWRSACSGTPAVPTPATAPRGRS